MRELLRRWGELTAMERMVLRRAVIASIVARIALIVVPWKRLAERKPPTMYGRGPDGLNLSTQWSAGVLAAEPANAQMSRVTRRLRKPPIRRQGRRRASRRDASAPTANAGKFLQLRSSARGPALTAPAAVALVRWATEVCARRVPFQTCLSSSLVARELLGFLGVQSTMEVGTYLDERGVIAFHASVTSDGMTICGERPMTVLASITSS